MTVDHIVLLNLKPDVTEDQIQTLKNKAATLTAIQGVTAVSCGNVFVEEWMQDRTAGKNFGLRITLESKDALRAYQDDERHVKIVKENIAPLIAEPPLACDWESAVVTPN